MINEIMNFNWKESVLTYILGSLIIFWFLYKLVKPKKIYSAEQYIGIDSPIAIQGKPDLVVWHEGKLRIKELKSRKTNMVYESDIWQLSIYRYILTHIQTKEVMNEADVLINKNGQLIEKTVKLRTNEEVEQLYYRYLNVHRGDVLPLLTKNKGFCKRCPHYNVSCFPDKQR